MDDRNKVIEAEVGTIARMLCPEIRDNDLIGFVTEYAFFLFD